jgi:hypothetical protein
MTFFPINSRNCSIQKLKQHTMKKLLFMLIVGLGAGTFHNAQGATSLNSLPVIEQNNGSQPATQSVQKRYKHKHKHKHFKHTRRHKK